MDVGLAGFKIIYDRGDFTSFSRAVHIDMFKHKNFHGCYKVKNRGEMLLSCPSSWIRSINVKDQTSRISLATCKLFSAAACGDEIIITYGSSASLRSETMSSFMSYRTLQ